MNHFNPFDYLPKLAAAVAVAALSLTLPARAADEETPKGETVTVIKATKACFANIVEVSGIVMARDEVSVRPERPGLKVAEVMTEPGDAVGAGQTLARLNLPDGGFVNVTAPVAGVVLTSTAVIGAMAGAKGEALFSIIARGEYDVVGLVPVTDLAKLAVNQPAAVHVIGTGDVTGRVHRIAPTVQADSQLGQVFIALNQTDKRLLVNASGRALIKTGQSCNIAVPLTAVQYGSAGTVVQVVKRDRVETRRVEIGLMSGGQIEIRDGISEGDDVVARAGALLREGDPVRPVTATAANTK
ncbi:MAG TPA: HlyD family efflux transporter periplasmic adaptor subunit [Bradyrhizobium sp.]|uniref:efflux RND transporter periplasmic adaptor subunit n=1 Tax=Bradyrhizobium sp. TaxID=376 RepID=UPI002CDE372B|nr:HlyD family efflux transporter periplasmic adaptor subunit [Bradyrhizobium sp.]HLZ04670.1 HlyD family efflux transporter periplasmic adaptor subunit [Bradyrhizobium sp.]